MSQLTKKQSAVLEFISKYQKEKKYSPSYREIMHHLGLASPGSVYRYIQVLQQKGKLDIKKHISRSIDLKPCQEATPSMTSIPYLGEIQKGFPLKTFSVSHSLNIPSSWVSLKESLYILKAKDSSLQEEEYICSGDLLIIQEFQKLEEGKRYLFQIHSSIFIKKYYHEGSYARLESENPSFRPIKIKHEHFMVQGELIGVLRNFDLLVPN